MLLIIPTRLEALCLFPYFRAKGTNEGLVALIPRSHRHGKERARRSLSVHPADHVLLHLCGVGPGAAARSTAAILRHLRPDEALMAGVCGALDPALGTGELMISSGLLPTPSPSGSFPPRGDALTATPSPWTGPRGGEPLEESPGTQGLSTEVLPALETDSRLAERARLACLSTGLAHRTGTLVTVGEPVLTHQRRLLLGRNTGACAVAMEDYPVGRLLLESGVPFLSVRAVSDPFDLDDPRLEGWLSMVALGGPSPSALRDLLVHPALLLSLARLGFSTAIALARLGLFLKAFLAGPSG